MNFVTGGTGLVGSHLIYNLLKRGEHVRALKRSTSNVSLVKKVISYYNSEASELFKKIEWIEGDILDYYAMEEAMKDVDYVYHCAAIVSFDNKLQQQIIHDNVNGTANLVNACLAQKITKLCHVSSIAAIGRSTLKNEVTEDAQWIDSKNKSAYSISKHLSEKEIWRGMAEGLNAVIVNPSIIFGPGIWNTGSSKLLSSVHKGLRFFSKGVTGYVDVKDVTEVMVMLMRSKLSGERYILNSENLSYEYVLKLIAKYLNAKQPSIYAKKWMSELVWRIERIKEILIRRPAFITKDTARTAHKKTYYSNQKISKALDFSFIPVEESIKSVSELFLKEN